MLFPCFLFFHDHTYSLELLFPYYSAFHMVLRVWSFNGFVLWLRLVVNIVVLILAYLLCTQSGYLLVPLSIRQVWSRCALSIVETWTRVYTSSQKTCHIGIGRLKSKCAKSSRLLHLEMGIVKSSVMSLLGVRTPFSCAVLCLVCGTTWWHCSWKSVWHTHVGRTDWGGSLVLW